MEQLLTTVLQSWGTPATGAAMVFLLVRLNNTVTAQKDAMIKLFHELDKRVTVIESKGK